jgi:hypothetical protein
MMKTNFFGLKPIAALLSFILAVTPVANVMAASSPPVGKLSNAFGLQAVENPDAGYIYEAAGMESISGFTASQSKALISYLDDLFTTNFNKYKDSGALDSSTQGSGEDVDVLFDNYKNAANSALSAIAALTSTSTATQIQSVITAISGNSSSSVMGAATIFMAAYFSNIDNSFMASAAEDLVDPLTKLAFATASNGVPLDVYVANVFQGLFADLVSKLALLETALQTANGNTSNTKNNARNAAANKRALSAGAKALGISVSQLNNVINASHCNTQATVVEQIACATAWYGVQTALLAAINKDIGAIETAAKAINSAVSAATTDIDDFVTTYSGQINSATSATTITAAYNDGVAKIDGVYPGLIGAHGSVEAQISAANTQESTIAADIAKVNVTIFASEITATNTSLAAAKASMASAVQAADVAYPQDLPSNMSDSNAATYASSVPGAAIITLYNDQKALTDPLGAVSSVVSALNTAVVNATNTISGNTSDVSIATAAINNVSTTTGSASDVDSALTNGINAIIASYNSTVKSGSALMTALASVDSLQVSLNTLNKTHSNITGLATAISSIASGVTAATTAFSALPAGTTLTAANAATVFPATSVPGLAIVSLSNIALVKKSSFIVSTLNAALGTATSAISGNTSDVSVATAAINNVSTTTGSASDVDSALTNGINAIIASYNSTVKSGSALMTALASADSLQASLNTLNKTHSNITGLATAISSVASGVTAATTAFSALPAGTTLTAANAATVFPATSVPGLAIVSLSNIALVKKSSFIVGTLNAALGAATSTISGNTSDVSKATAAINASKSTSDVTTQLNDGIAAIVASYNSTMESGSAFMTALAKADKLQVSLNTLNEADPSIADLATEISSVASGVKSAKAAFPVLPSGTTLSDANAATTLPVTSVPGEAIASLTTVANTKTASLSSGGSSGLSGGAIAAIAAAAAVLISAAIALGIYVYKKGQKIKLSDDDDTAAKLEPEVGKLDPQRISDLEKQLKALGSKPDNTELDGVAKDNPVFKNLVSLGLNQNAAKELGVSNENFSTFKDLIDNSSGKSIAQRIKGVTEKISDITNIENSPTVNDILNTVANNMPDNFTGNSAEALDLVAKTLEANPNLDITSADDFKAAAKAVLEADSTTGPSTGPPGTGEQKGPEGNNGEDPTTGTETGVKVPADKIFDGMTNETAAENVQTLKQFITSNDVTKADFVKQIADLGTKIESLQGELDQASDEGKDAIEEEIANVKAQELAANEVEADTGFEFPIPEEG